MLAVSPAGAHIPALSLQPARAPTSPGGKNCLASLKAVPSGFWMVREWDPALTPPQAKVLPGHSSKVSS